MGSSWAALYCWTVPNLFRYHWMHVWIIILHGANKLFDWAYSFSFTSALDRFLINVMHVQHNVFVRLLCDLLYRSILLYSQPLVIVVVVMLIMGWSLDWFGNSLVDCTSGKIKFVVRHLCLGIGFGLSVVDRLYRHFVKIGKEIGRSKWNLQEEPQDII